MKTQLLLTGYIVYFGLAFVHVLDGKDIQEWKKTLQNEALADQNLFNHMKDELQRTKNTNIRRRNSPSKNLLRKREANDNDSNHTQLNVVPKTSLGCTSLKEIRDQKAIYIDRTEMAYNLIKEKGIFLFMRPRRFGKTLLLNLFEVILRHNENDRQLLQHTYVQNLVQELPTYIVLKFDLSNLNTIKEFEAQLWKYASFYGVAEEIRKSETLHVESEKLKLESVKLKLERLKLQRELQQLNKGFTMDQNKDQSQEVTIMDKDEDEDEVQDRSIFRFLISDLWKHHNKSVAVLVDEYNIAFENNSERIRKYFLKIFRSFKELNIEYLKFAFITGCDKVKMNIRGENSNHGLGTTLGITEISSEAKFANILGFTEVEIRKHYHVLVEQKAIACNKPVEAIYKQMRYRYNGYQFGDDDLPRVYNPISVMAYLEDKDDFEGDNYWADTVPEQPVVIERLIQNRIDLNQFLLDLNSFYDKEQLYGVEVKLPSQTSNKNDRSLESLLFRHGYLTTCRKENDMRLLSFPNKEAVEAFRKIVANALANSKRGVDLAEIAWESLEKLDMGTFAKSFNEYIIENNSYHQMTTIIEHDLESLFKHFINVMMKHTGKCEDCEMHRESTLTNQKRPDFIFDTKSNRIYVEFKYESLEEEFKEKYFKQLKGYKFYNSDKNPHKKGENAIRVKYLVNFNSKGIAQWYGPIKYKTEDNEDEVSKNEIFDNKFLNKICEFSEFVCRECEPPLPFGNKYTYNAHMSKNIHRPCQKCGKHFFTMQGLHSHLKTHNITSIP